MGVSSGGLNSLQRDLLEPVTTDRDLGWCWSRGEDDRSHHAAPPRVSGGDGQCRPGEEPRDTLGSCFGDRGCGQTDKHYGSGRTEGQLKVVRGSCCSDGGC